MENTSKRRKEISEAEELRKLGFEFEGPVDGYSDQPDSGSTIGGERGRQEYGITGGIAGEPDHADKHGRVSRDLSESGLSEFTEKNAEEPEEMLHNNVMPFKRPVKNTKKA